MDRWEPNHTFLCNLHKEQCILHRGMIVHIAQKPDIIFAPNLPYERVKPTKPYAFLMRFDTYQICYCYLSYSSILTNTLRQRSKIFQHDFTIPFLCNMTTKLHSSFCRKIDWYKVFVQDAQMHLYFHIPFFDTSLCKMHKKSCQTLLYKVHKKYPPDCII